MRARLNLSQAETMYYSTQPEVEDMDEEGAEQPSAASARIAIVDDESLNCKVARKLLSHAGYSEFLIVNEAIDAFNLIVRYKPDVILLDIMMPGISGLEILQKLRQTEAVSHVPVLILTASCDDSTRKQALDLGATDFLPKPVNANELIPRVRNAVILKTQHDRLKTYARDLEHRVRVRTAELMLTQMEVVYCLARAAEFRDDDTGKHVVRVGRYAGIIARQMGLTEREVELIEHAAPLHDVGKIGIPDAILQKPGKLTEEEFDYMRKHSVLGKNIIEPLSQGEVAVWQTHADIGRKLIGDTDIPLLKVAAKIALTHHEKWDGSGYPLGLKGEDIPIEGRIVAVADVFDALSSRRPYKVPFSREKCFEILSEGRGRHFDPAVVDAFFAVSGQITATQLEFAD